ncbi:MAG: hypothetical protein WCJ42_06120 [Actinomycetes bacterium]
MGGANLIAAEVVRGGPNHYLVGVGAWAVLMLLLFLTTRFNAKR